MNKRQRKKKEKKYLSVIADEFNLMTMTKEEEKKAMEGYMRFRERFAYRKKYKDLKYQKALIYYFPPGEKMSNFIQEITSRARSPRRGTTLTVTQSLQDFQQ